MAEKKKEAESVEEPVVQEDIHPEGSKISKDSIVEARRPLPHA